MEKPDVTQPIFTILNGSNYMLWVQGMRSFLKGRRYVIYDIKLPEKSVEEPDDKFVDCLEEWDSKNHQIITWFRNTSTPSINLQFGRYDTAKEPARAPATATHFRPETSVKLGDFSPFSCSRIPIKPRISRSVLLCVLLPLLSVNCWWVGGEIFRFSGRELLLQNPVSFHVRRTWLLLAGKFWFLIVLSV
ncbi:hypothetical protein SLEP1_g22785 [Rubroshorea leprosula]|uniref:Retrotransposon Copia-like N-terminal domain-containing protein n=1 Tax=Rubroshorea leprosula TaxID=152421 RepID=A0AAV5JGD7_9ROSI|nr:hypothetical protein SLEP1_g22785 [Rubroshorea leprosula]